MVALANRSAISGRAVGGLVATAVGVAAVVAAGPGARPALVAAALVVALAGFAVMLHALRRGAGLPLRLVLGVGAVLTALCVALPPAGSKDVASYALYGRIVTEHGENPYTTVPDDHPEDPWYPDVSTRWRQTPSVYGPAFTVLSAAITAVGGEHRTLIRLLFQASAGLALVASALLVARLTGDPAATAFVALNPVLLASVVNGAHNDALVGAALLGACVAARRRWWVAAGALAALAAGVKVAAILALPALAAWAWRRHGWRPATAIAASAG
ncbi:MAG: glycosyltransferase 87 family protein, partial [Acidimicrobiales bacterium]